MKVRMVVWVEMDDAAVQDWTDTFGVEGKRAVGNDVKQYLGNELHKAGVFGSGEIDAEISWE